MNKPDIPFKKATPYLVAIILFALLSIMYFSPLLEGKKMVQGDIARFKGMAKEIQDHRENTGEEALWTGGMFSGMPAYMTSVKFKGNQMSKIDPSTRPSTSGKLFVLIFPGLLYVASCYAAKPMDQPCWSSGLCIIIL